MDPAWRTFTAKLVSRSDAAVAPVFFEGANSRTFQIASHLHYALRMGLLINEFRRRVGGTVRAVVGAPLPRAEIEARRGDARALMDYLRLETYRLSPRPLPDLGYGYEFEAGWQ
jgi:putative hemolysin